MTDVVAVADDGATHTISAVDGASLMEALRDRDLVLALCGGCMSCGTCHVYVDRAYLDRLPPMSDDEANLLDSSAHRKPHSRLSCQIPMTTELQGLMITVAPQE